MNSTEHSSQGRAGRRRSGVALDTAWVGRVGRRRIVWCGMALGAVLAGVHVASASDWEMFKNRVSVNTHIGFNLKAEFSHLGEIPEPTDPGPDLAGVNHFYDDGFNRVDVSGNAGGKTFYWGYGNADQIPDGSDNLLLTSTAAAASQDAAEISDAPHWGAEIVYTRQLGWSRAYWWGVEVGFVWMDMDFQDDLTTRGDVVRTTDAYALGGIEVPPAPYTGTFSGPGPRISDDPQRVVQTLSQTVVTTGSYDLDASLYAVRLGLVYETPFTRNLTLQFGGGVMGGLVHSEFRFEERTSIPALGTFRRSASDTEEDFVGGAYAHAGLALHFSQRMMASLGVQYNYLSSFSQEVAGRKAEIELKNSLYVALGVGVTF